MTFEAKVYYTVSEEDFKKMVNSKKSASSEAEHYILNHTHKDFDRNERMYLFGIQLAEAIREARKNKG